MKKHPILITSLSMMALMTQDAIADWNVGSSYFSINGDLPISLKHSHQSIAASAGYSVKLNHNLFISTHSYLGIEFDSDASIFSSSRLLELDSLYGQDLHLGYQATEYLSLMLGAQYLYLGYKTNPAASGPKDGSDAATGLSVAVQYTPSDIIRLDTAFTKSEVGEILRFGLQFLF